MKKILIRTTAVIMAIVMASLMSLQIFAAGEKLYISDLMIATGSSVAAAKKKLTAKGYTVIENNLNEDNEDVVLLGYMTTKNKDEAITDLAVMNMKGGYRFEDYAHVLEEYKETADELVDELYVAVTEYKTNYNAGKYGALIAHALLNRFYDTDFGETDNLLGDILLRDDLTKDQLSVIFMQATNLAVMTIESCLGVAVTDNWIDRFLSMPENTEYTTADDDDARTVYRSLEAFQEEMKLYTDIMDNCTLTMNSSEEEWSAFYASLSELEQQTVTSYANTYDYLNATEYKNGTLYDFFMQDLDEIDNADLYPLAKAMTPGQIATVNYAGLSTAIKYSVTADELLNKMLEGVTGEKDIRTVSVFDGVDRSIFEADGIALTSEAMRQATSSSDYSWWKGNLSKETEAIYYGIMGTVGGIAVAGIAVYAVASSKLAAIGTAAYQKAFASVALNPYLPPDLFVDYDAGETLAEVVAELEPEDYVYALDREGLMDAIAAEKTAIESSAWHIVSGAAKIISAVAIAIVLITLVIYLVEEYKAYNEDKTYTKIPRIIVDQVTNEDGTRSYTYYYAVKNTSDNYADLNSFHGDEWNALYYTKDATAGDPILADYTVQSGHAYTGVDSSYTLRVHAFGSTAAYNLNKYSKHATKLIYMFFKTDDSAGLAGTAVTYGTYSLVAVAGIAAGAAGMFVLDKFLFRKKKENLA